jgi:PKD repeat protein
MPMQRRTASVLALTGLLVVAGLVGVGFIAPPNPGPAAAAAPSPPSVLGPHPSPSEIEVAPAFAGAAGTRDLGAVVGSTPFDVAVGLALQNASGLAADLAALYVPGTPAYHAFLSTHELASRFGASPKDLASASAYFARFGLHVTASPDRLMLDVEGPASEIGPAFGTSFDAYLGPAGREFVSHPTPASLPGIVPWTGVFGLGNETALTPTATSSSEPVPLLGPDASCSESGPFIPCQVWQAYDMAATISGGTTGAGETIGIVDAYDSEETQTMLASDLVDFDAFASLPAPTVNYLYPVPSDHDLNTTSTQWGLEEALDLQWAHASAPGASIDMTFSPNPNVGLYQAVDYLVAHQSVNVLTMSWGEPDTGVYNAYLGPCDESCNASTDGSYALLSPVLEFAAAEGISVFAASGDCGAADGTSGLATNFPASDPYVTGVGGTSLSTSSNGTWMSEAGWSGNASGAISPGCQNQGGSGGGFAPYPRPWWQSGEGVPVTDALRGVPDVSAVSVPGVILYYNGFQSDVGGTSLSSPIWAGISALADQYAHHALGLLNPSLYSILRGPGYASDFRDITSGTNTYSAGPGWDPITGIGTPIVGALLPALAAPPTGLTSLEVNLSVSRMSGAAPLPVTFTVSASEGAGGYSAEGVYFGDGNASEVVDGEVTHTYPTAGVYSAQAYAFDRSGNFSVSLPVALVVGGGSALRTNLTVSNPTPGRDVPVTLTATTTGGTTPYSFLYYFGDGTYQNWTSGPAIVHSYGTNGSFCAVVLARDAASPIDGGISAPVPVAVGGAPAPVCSVAPPPLVATPVGNGTVRDAPAEYPSLFAISGGAGTVSLQYRSTDPYVGACGCDLFRAEGNPSVWLYANQSEGPPVVAEANVTVAPALRVVFTASPTFGPAPLTVKFDATVSGGYEANPALLNWTFGNGASALGPSTQEMYTIPGTYWAVGHLSDGGYGNASEAFLIDVGPSTPSAAPYLNATIAPAFDLSSGATVRYAAQAHAWNGTGTAANFTWQVGTPVMGYTADVNRTYYTPATGVGQNVEFGNLSVTFASTGANLSVPFVLHAFFASETGGFVPRVDALSVSDSGGPATGARTLFWKGVAVPAGPGTFAVNWSFGDGGVATGLSATHLYSNVGKFTEVVVVSDSWGDQAVDSSGVDATNGSAIPLTLVSGPSVESGNVPLTVSFTAVGSGGNGAPYTYAWNFGDGAVSSVANVSHTYTKVGTYTANITVHDSGSASVSRSYVILVSSAPPGGGPILGVLPRSVSLALLVVGAGAATGVLLAAGARRRTGPGVSAPTL